MSSGPILFGDEVRVRDTQAALEIGAVGLRGRVYGTWSPSVRGVQVIGDARGANAVLVDLEGRGGGFWFAPDQLDVLAHANGSVVRIGRRTWTRTPEGEWRETKSEDDPREGERRRS